MMSIEALGVVATLFVVSSFILSGEARIRRVNIIGAVLFVIYGIVIGAFSVWLLNGMLVLIHVYKLMKEGKFVTKDSNFMDKNSRLIIKSNKQLMNKEDKPVARIVLATNNENKLREVREILPQFDVLSQKDVGFVDEVVEDGETFAENALKKAREVREFCGMTVIADDSGICVDALDGAPGVYSARYSGAGDAGNNEKLLRELEGETNRKAHFVCALAVCSSDGGEHIIEEQWHGVIADSSAGDGGFGYDKVFIPDGYDVRSSQITAEEKNRISHRGKALRRLMEILQISY